jgi:hypothetical protein
MIELVQFKPSGDTTGTKRMREGGDPLDTGVTKQP